MGQFDYSVVVPVYNSANTLEELCQRIYHVFEKSGLSCQVVLVNDGSVDGSWAVIKKLKDRYGDRLTGVNLARNVGQHKALLCGFHFVRGKCAITIDDDLQIPPEEIEKLIEKHKTTGADLVYGIFKQKQHARWRNMGSRLIERIFNLYGSTPGKGSSFKLIAGPIIEKMREINHGYVYIDELLSWYASRIEFTTVEHLPRTQGSSGYSFFQLVFLSINIILNYTVIPLRLMTWIGLTAAVVCLLIGVYFIYMKLTYGAQLGFTSLIVAIFFSTGLILFSLGIIGEYISRIFAIQSKKPQFTISEVL